METALPSSLAARPRKLRWALTGPDCDFLLVGMAGQPPTLRRNTISIMRAHERSVAWQTAGTSPAMPISCDERYRDPVRSRRMSTTTPKGGLDSQKNAGARIKVRWNGNTQLTMPASKRKNGLRTRRRPEYRGIVGPRTLVLARASSRASRCNPTARSRKPGTPSGYGGGALRLPKTDARAVATSDPPLPYPRHSTNRVHDQLRDPFGGVPIPENARTASPTFCAGRRCIQTRHAAAAIPSADPAAVYGSLKRPRPSSGRQWSRSDGVKTPLGGGSPPAAPQIGALYNGVMASWLSASARASDRGSTASGGPCDRSFV